MSLLYTSALLFYLNTISRSQFYEDVFYMISDGSKRIQYEFVYSQMVLKSYLCTNLVSALTGLNVNDFPHCGYIVFGLFSCKM